MRYPKLWYLQNWILSQCCSLENWILSQFCGLENWILSQCFGLEILYPCCGLKNLNSILILWNRKLNFILMLWTIKLNFVSMLWSISMLWSLKLHFISMLWSRKLEFCPNFGGWEMSSFIILWEKKIKSDIEIFVRKISSQTDRRTHTNPGN